MNKNIMFPNLIQKIISLNEIDKIKETLEYNDSANKYRCIHTSSIYD